MERVIGPGVEVGTVHLVASEAAPEAAQRLTRGGSAATMVANMARFNIFGKYRMGLPGRKPKDDQAFPDRPGSSYVARWKHATRSMQEVAQKGISVAIVNSTGAHMVLRDVS